MCCSIGGLIATERLVKFAGNAEAKDKAAVEEENGAKAPSKSGSVTRW